MFIKRATRGFQYGLGYLFARDFYSKSKELGPAILIIIFCIAGPIAISLYFFRKINDLVYSISQGEKKDTGEHVSIFKRFLSITILPFMITSTALASNLRAPARKPRASQQPGRLGRGGGSVAIVRQRLQHDGGASGPVPLVCDLRHLVLV